MSIHTGRLSAIIAFGLLLSTRPGTGLAYPISTPSTATASQSTATTNPVRSLLNIFGVESSSLWAALDSVYSDGYVDTACQEPC